MTLAKEGGVLGITVLFNSIQFHLNIVALPFSHILSVFFAFFGGFTNVLAC